MSETKFTPAPWYADIRGGIYAIFPEKDGRYTCLSGMSEHAVVSQCGRGKESSPGSWRFLTEEQEANARLIAAAPELLGLLEKLYALTHLDIMDKAYNPDYAIDVDELAAVIAKAKGEDVPSPVFRSVVDLGVDEKEGGTE